MTEIISLQRLTFRAGKHLALSGSLLALLACRAGSAPGSDEVFIESLSTAPAVSTPSKTDAQQVIQADKPLQLGFDHSAYLVSDSGSLLYRGPYLAFVPDQGHLQLGSVLVKDRQETWHGPFLKLPMLEPGTAYRASIWVKPVDTRQPSQVKLILTRVVQGISTSLVLGEIKAEPEVWQKVDGEFVGAAHWSDDITALSLDVDSIDTRYLFDDVMVAYAEFSDELEAAAAAVVAGGLALLRNGDVEDGLEHWSHQGGVISRSNAQAHSGEHSLLVSGRSEGWHGPTMALRGLKDYTRYHFGVFVRLNEGEQPANVQLTMKRVTKGQVSFIPIANALASSTDWVKIGGAFSAPNISESEEIILYVESNNPTASYFVDTLTAEEVVAR